MNTALLPGMGDYEAAPVASPLDPRIYDDADESDDTSLDALAKIRDFADRAEVAHAVGDMEKALQCLDEIRAICDEILQ